MSLLFFFSFLTQPLISIPCNFELLDTWLLGLENFDNAEGLPFECFGIFPLIESASAVFPQTSISMTYSYNRQQSPKH